MEDLLEEIRRQWGKPVHCAHCKETDADFHQCSKCGNVFCNVSCQSIGDSCRIGVGAKRTRKEAKEKEKPVELTKDVFSVIMKFLELEDLKNVSIASKRMTSIARRAMINRYRWVYDPDIMDMIRPKRIYVVNDTYDDYISDKLVMETDIITSVYFDKINFGYQPILPNHVEHVIFQAVISEQMDLSNLRVLKKIEFIESAEGFDGPLKLPPNLEELDVGSFFTHPLILPNSLKELVFDRGCEFNHPLVLPPNLRVLWLHPPYNRPLQLPNGLLELTLGNEFNQPIQFPHTITKLYLMSSEFDQPGTTLPSNLKEVLISGHLTEFEFPATVEKIGITTEYADAFGILIQEGTSIKGIKIDFI